VHNAIMQSNVTKLLKQILQLSIVNLLCKLFNMTLNCRLFLRQEWWYRWHFEHWLLMKFESFLFSSNLQLAFKKKLGCSPAFVTLTEVVKYFVARKKCIVLHFNWCAHASLMGVRVLMSSMLVSARNYSRNARACGLFCGNCQIGTANCLHS